MNPKHNAARSRAAHANELSASRAAVALALVVFAFGGALAQQEQEQTAPQQKTDGVTAAPPPLRYIPEEVRRRLEDEHDLKARTHLALDLAEERLARSAERANADRFEEATAELGVYEAVIADAVGFVQSQFSGRAKNRERDLLKHVEMTLRSHVPRLETIRRTLPAAHAAYVKSTIEFVNRQRDQALNSFYSNTVMRESAHGKDDKDKPAVGERANGTAAATPDAEKKPNQR